MLQFFTHRADQLVNPCIELLDFGMLFGELYQQSLLFQVQCVKLLNVHHDRVTNLHLRSTLQRLLSQLAIFLYLSQHPINNTDGLDYSIFIALTFGDLAENDTCLGIHRDDIVFFSVITCLFFRTDQLFPYVVSLFLDEFSVFFGLSVLLFVIVFLIDLGENIRQIPGHDRVGIRHLDHQNIGIALLIDIDTTL